VEWPVVDRFTLEADGRASRRVTYFDSFPLLLATATRPSAWWPLWKSGALGDAVRAMRGGSETLST
jgi:hypothetical protein